jgi:hypothetical protein
LPAANTQRNLPAPNPKTGYTGAVIVRRNKTVHVRLGGKTVASGEHTKENPYIHRIVKRLLRSVGK